MSPPLPPTHHVIGQSTPQDALHLSTGIIKLAKQRADPLDSFGRKSRSMTRSKGVCGRSGSLGCKICCLCVGAGIGGRVRESSSERASELLQLLVLVLILVLVLVLLLHGRRRAGATL